MSNLNFVLNLVSTWYMVGLIWMVQIVHYAMFDRVGSQGFATYEADHSRLITPIVGVPMLIELATATMLIAWPPAGMSRGVAVAGLVMVGLIWLSTAAIQIPYHNQLAAGFDPAAHRGLVNTNWIRTVLWSARGALMGWVLWRMLTPPTA